MPNLGLNLSSNDWTTFISSPISESLLQKSGIENISLKLKYENNIISKESSFVNSYISALVSSFIRKQLVKAKIDFSFESVLSHKSKQLEILEAKQNSFKTYLYFICIDDPSINISRVQNRVDKGGHSVSIDKIKSRYVKTLQNINSVIEICDKSYLFDNSSDKLTLIAKVFNNKLELTIEPEELPDWFIKYVLEYYNI